MPQPLTQVASISSWSIGRNAFERNPQFAVDIVDVINTMSVTDNIKGLINAEILASSNVAGIRQSGADHAGLMMYMSIKSDRAKTEALMAAADAVLEPAEMCVLRALTKRSAGAIKRRNDFAHGMWGFAEDLPDALLLVPAGRYLDHWCDSKDVDILPDFVDPSEIQVYRSRDFEESRQLAGLARSLHYDFRHYLILKKIVLVGSELPPWDIEFDEELYGPTPKTACDMKFHDLQVSLGLRDRRR